MSLSKNITVATAVAAAAITGSIAIGTSTSVQAASRDCNSKMVSPIVVNGTTATGTFKVPEGCAPQQVSFSVYKRHANVYPLSEQRIHSYKTGSYSPGTHTVSIAMPEAGCYYQADLFRGGPNLKLVKPTYRDVLMGYKLGGNKDCLVKPAPTKPADKPAPAPSTAKPVEPAPAPETPAPAPAEEAPEAPVATLPETGPANIGLMASAVTAVSTLGHLIVRRFSR